MSTTAELLVTLNQYRVRMQLKPLKAWKESRAKIETAVAAIPAHMLADDMQHAGEDDVPTDEELAAAQAYNEDQGHVEALEPEIIPPEECEMHELEEPNANDNPEPELTREQLAEARRLLRKKEEQRKEKPQPTEEPKYIMLTAICREIGKLPKVGRAMARRYAPKEGYEWLVQFEGNWRFPIEKKEEVIALLQSSKKT